MIEKFITLMLAGPQRDEKGATATEYGLLVGLIALIIVGAVTAFGGNLSDFFDGLADTVGTW